MAQVFPSDAKTAGNDVTTGSRNGMVNDQGTLIGQSGQNFLELTFYAGGKMKGWFYYDGVEGPRSLPRNRALVACDLPLG